MRDLIRSMVRLSVAAPMLAVKQAAEMWSRTGRASLSGELDSITGALRGQMDESSRDLYESGESVGRRVLDGFQGRSRNGSSSATAASPAESGDDPRPGDLDVRTVVVLGEGLAAGFGEFSLAEESQRESFPAQLAAHMGVELTQPDIESPGLGEAPGYAALPVTVPALMQTTALTGFPPADAPRNLSVPGFRVADAVGLRPVPPVVRQDDVRQTLANLILGGADLLAGGQELPTQLERAVALKPGLAIVELGYYEALEAAVAGDASRLPDAAAFEADYGRLLAGLRGSGAAVVAMTVPDPLDTAYYSSLESAAANLRLEPRTLTSTWSLAEGDRVSVPALIDMGYQMLADAPGELPPGGVLKAAVAEELGKGVAALNEVVRKVAAAHGAEVFDLAALIRRVAAEGLPVGRRHLSADFLGGFYQLNGYYPGATGQALIADELVVHLNAAHGSSFRRVDLEAAMRRDPAAGQRRAGGPVSSPAEKREGARTGVTQVAHRRASGSGSKTGRRRAGEGRTPSAESPLQLPPGLEQTLPISKAASYFGDAIRAAHCRREDEQTFGSGRELLFGGLAMVDSHLQGAIRIRFSEPENGTSRFEVFHGRLEGDDGTLQAPQFFKLPALRNEVRDDDALVSTGVLDLATGEVSDLAYAVRFFNTALMALVRANPRLPDVPILFPGLYGSAWARFDQRDDGLLDFSFYGTTFIPLGGAMEGDPVRFPLPLAGPTLEFASIPAPGTSLHPHLHITTKEPEEVPTDRVPEIPVNTVREYTLYTRTSSFGDKFTLHAEELAGDPTGRSHLLGRVQVQFGAPSGDSVPVAVSCLNPGGMLAEAAPSPLADMFPGRLPPSPIGHNEFLRFATRSYFLDALTCIDDPFDVSVGNVSRTSGLFLGDLLHRALIGQNLFYALLRVEPRTPKSSFHFRGPARFDKGRDGRAVLRFYGQVNIAYPEGYLFPSPDMATGVRIGPDSELDPFYWIRAVEHDRSTDAAMSGGASDVLSSAGERFSYEYDIRGDRAEGPSRFEYENHSVGGVFRLETLSWVSFVDSQEPGSAGRDTVTFSGFGTWSRDQTGRKHLVCAQICEAENARYVSIQVDGGRTSNVNTRPPNLEDVRP